MAVETLAVADRADVRVDVPAKGGPTQPGGRIVTLIAVFDGKQWASLAPELDIASVGDDSDEALSNLGVAIRRQSPSQKKLEWNPVNRPPRKIC